MIKTPGPSFKYQPIFGSPISPSTTNWRREQNVEMAASMKAAGHKSIDIAMIPNRNHATIWSRVGDTGDETADRIIRFVSRP
jgi:hypothetical protein